MSRWLGALAFLASLIAGACTASTSSTAPSALASAPPVATASAAAVAPSTAAPATNRPTPAPIPTALPRPVNLTVDGTCEPDRTCLGLLSPGKYHTQVLVPGFSFTISDPGWENIGQAGGNFAFLSTTEPGDAILVFWRPRPTKADGSLVFGIPSNVAGIGSWLEQNKDLALTNPANVTVGGLRGRRWDIETAPTATARDPGCPTMACITFLRGTDPSSQATWQWDWGVATSERMRLYLLDGPTDVTAIVVDSLDGTTFDTLSARADKILPTIKFDRP
jgi:hypothetical protein